MKQKELEEEKRGLHVVCKFANKSCYRNIGFIFNLKNRERPFTARLEV